MRCVAMNTESKRIINLPQKDNHSPPLKPPFNFDSYSIWALWLAEIGHATSAWKIFPLRSWEKRPLHKGWQAEATCNLEVVESIWRKNPDANIGLAIQPGFVAVDIDDWSALKILESEHQKLPSTYRQNTPRGGAHFIYSTELDTGNSTGSLPKGIDIRGHGGFIVGAGSVLMNEVQSAKCWSIESNLFPQPLPGWFETRLSERGISKGTQRKSIGEKKKYDDFGQPSGWDKEHASRLIEFVNEGFQIKEYSGPFLEGERDNLTFRLFAEAKNRMIHPDIILEATLNSGIDGGLGDDIVVQKMRSAYHEGNTQDAYGAKVPAYWFQNHLFERHKGGIPIGYLKGDPIKWKAANQQRLPEAFPGDPKLSPELPKGENQPFYYLGMFDNIPEPTWIIDGILPENGYSLIYGKRSTKKSFIALDIGLSLATKTSYHGRTVKPGRVVYFAGEGFRGNRRRVSAWFKARELNADDYAKNFALVPFTGKWDTAAGRETVQTLLHEIAKDGPISLVIIDTARRAMSGDENAPSAVGQFLDGVGDVCRQFNCGQLIVHHAGKDESKGARGGGPFEDDADAVFHVTKASNDIVRFKCTKQKDDEADWTMLFRAHSILLGCEAEGKQITSLALLLDVDAKVADNDISHAVREKYYKHDAIAVRILKQLQDTCAKRGELAAAVMDEMFPGLRDKNSITFAKDLRAYRAHLSRLSSKHELWQFISKKNENGAPTHFLNPKNRKSRVASQERRGRLNYSQLKQGDE